MDSFPTISARTSARRALSVALWAYFLAACASAAAPHPVCPVAAPQAPATVPAEGTVAALPETTDLDEAARLALFDTLAAAIAERHVFSETTWSGNFGRTWSSRLPGLREVFREARDTDALEGALTRLGNSLHDPHAVYNSPRRPRRITLPITLDVEWVAGVPRYYVVETSDAAFRTQLQAGDVLVEADGVQADALLETHFDVLRGNQWSSLAADLAHWLTDRERTVSEAREGRESRYVFRRRSGESTPISVSMNWRLAEGGTGDSADWPEYDLDWGSARCAGRAPREYGPYSLSGHGLNFCVYTSDVAPFRDHPIVRYVSFLYTNHDGSGGDVRDVVRADGHNLSAQLARRPGTRGVILDLRDNRGGNNPYWFLDWFAPRPFGGHWRQTRLHPDVAARLRARGDTEGLAAFERALANPAADGFTPRRPFTCGAGGCDAPNTYAPGRRATTRPVALLVGPTCMSACDTFASTFAVELFGPVVGEPTSAATSPERFPFPIPSADGRDLGFLILSYGRALKADGSVAEGATLPLTDPVARTFENRTRYDALLVTQAIAALRRAR
jgi:C-terminal processing protease CtpA/Prc